MYIPDAYFDGSLRIDCGISIMSVKSDIWTVPEGLGGLPRTLSGSVDRFIANYILIAMWIADVSVLVCMVPEGFGGLPRTLSVGVNWFCQRAIR